MRNLNSKKINVAQAGQQSPTGNEDPKTFRGSLTAKAVSLGELDADDIVIAYVMKILLVKCLI